MTEFDQDTKVTVTILEKSFQIKCPENKVHELQSAADHLNREMRRMRQNGIIGIDRIAIISALNITYELLEIQKQRDEYIKMLNARIRELQSRIDNALTKAEQLEFNETNTPEK